MKVAQCRKRHHFVTANWRQTPERAVKRLYKCACARKECGRQGGGVVPGCITQPLDPIYFIQGRLSPHSRYIMQHSPVFSSSPRQIDPSSFFLSSALLFSSRSRWGCPLTDFAESEREGDVGNKRGKERREVTRGREEGN